MHFPKTVTFLMDTGDAPVISVNPRSVYTHTKIESEIKITIIIINAIIMTPKHIFLLRNSSPS